MSLLGKAEDAAEKIGKKGYFGDALESLFKKYEKLEKRAGNYKNRASKLGGKKLEQAKDLIGYNLSKEEKARIKKFDAEAAKIKAEIEHYTGKPTKEQAARLKVLIAGKRRILKRAEKVKDNIKTGAQVGAGIAAGDMFFGGDE